jgi:hypothetical protein
MTVGEEGVGGQVRNAFSMGSGITPPAPEIGWPPPSNISDRLAATRAPFGQKPLVARFGSSAVRFVAGAAFDKPRPLAATAADAPAVRMAWRRFTCNEFSAGPVIVFSAPPTICSGRMSAANSYRKLSEGGSPGAAIPQQPGAPAPTGG